MTARSRRRGKTPTSVPMYRLVTTPCRVRSLPEPGLLMPAVNPPPIVWVTSLSAESCALFTVVSSSPPTSSSLSLLTFSYIGVITILITLLVVVTINTVVTTVIMIIIINTFIWIDRHTNNQQDRQTGRQRDSQGLVTHRRLEALSPSCSCMDNGTTRQTYRQTDRQIQTEMSGSWSDLSPFSFCMEILTDSLKDRQTDRPIDRKIKKHRQRWMTQAYRQRWVG